LTPANFLDGRLLVFYQGALLLEKRAAGAKAVQVRESYHTAAAR
jgi:hypothetical protein